MISKCHDEIFMYEYIRVKQKMQTTIFLRIQAHQIQRLLLGRDDKLHWITFAMAENSHHDNNQSKMNPYCSDW